MKLTPKYYARAWYELIQSGEKSSDKILKFIYKNGHLSWLKEIVANLEELLNKQEQNTKVTVTSAKELEREVIEKIVKQIIKNEKFSIETKIDPSLIAGLIIETKNKRWNLSASKKLSQIKNKLIS